MNPLLNHISGLPYHDLLKLSGYAFANVLTAIGAAALARGFRLLQSGDRYQLVISPLWIVALLAGVAPGALLGIITRAFDAGVPISASDFGLWVLSAVLAIVTMGPAIFGSLLGFSAHTKAAAKPWEAWVICALVLALFLWFALASWRAAEELVEPMLFTMPLAWLALRFSQRTTSIAVATVAAGISVVAAYRTGGDLSPADVPAWSDIVISIDIFLLIGCGGALLINLMTVKQRALLEELEREHAQLRQYAHALDSAEESARRATAADLHDGIGQVLAGHSMTLAAMRAHAGPAQTRRRLIEEAIERGARGARGPAAHDPGSQPAGARARIARPDPQVAGGSIRDAVRIHRSSTEVDGSAELRPRSAAARVSLRPRVAHERLQAFAAAMPPRSRWSSRRGRWIVRVHRRGRRDSTCRA